MALLYLVTESDRDALFYQKCAARLGQKEFSWWRALPNRKGNGASAVQKQLKYALRQAKGSAQGAEEVCFIAAIDNDRTPHEENEDTLQRDKLSNQERKRNSRQQWILETVNEVMGPNPAAWPLSVAVAVPVEMVESWIVKALGVKLPSGPMPHFSKQSQAKAREYYQPVAPPPQWKDLELQARCDCGLSVDEEFYELAASEIAAKADALGQAAVSFRLFRDQLAQW